MEQDKNLVNIAERTQEEITGQNKSTGTVRLPKKMTDGLINKRLKTPFFIQGEKDDEEGKDISLISDYGLLFLLAIYNMRQGMIDAHKGIIQKEIGLHSFYVFPMSVKILTAFFQCKIKGGRDNQKWFNVINGELGKIMCFDRKTESGSKVFNIFDYKLDIKEFEKDFEKGQKCEIKHYITNFDLYVNTLFFEQEKESYFLIKRDEIITGVSKNRMYLNFLLYAITKRQMFCSMENYKPTEENLFEYLIDTNIVKGKDLEEKQKKLKDKASRYVKVFYDVLKDSVENEVISNFTLTIGEKTITNKSSEELVKEIFKKTIRITKTTFRIGFVKNLKS